MCTHTRMYVCMHTCLVNTNTLDLHEGALSCRGQCGVSWRLPNGEISSPSTNFLSTKYNTFPSELLPLLSLLVHLWFWHPERCWDASVCSVHDDKHITAKYLTLVTFMLGSDLALYLLAQRSSCNNPQWSQLWSSFLSKHLYQSPI